MVSIETILATERRLLEPICSFIEKDAYLIYFSERFPHFYAANGIEIRATASRSLARWEEMFK